MGVSYYQCNCCKQSQYEEYIGYCTECGNTLCTECLVNDDIESEYAYKYGIIYDGSEAQKKEFGIEDHWEEKGWVVLGKVIDDTSIAPKYCPYCSGEELDEDKFAQWLYQKLGKSRDDLIKEFKENS